MTDILDGLTAKEIAEEALGALEFAKKNPDLWLKDLEFRINQHTLSIIEKAETSLKEENKKEPNDDYKRGFLDGMSNLSSRVKQMVGEKEIENKAQKRRIEIHIYREGDIDRTFTVKNLWEAIIVSFRHMDQHPLVIIYDGKDEYARFEPERGRENY